MNSSLKLRWRLALALDSTYGSRRCESVPLADSRFRVEGFKPSPPRFPLTLPRNVSSSFHLPLLPVVFWMSDVFSGADILY